jgi:hypothetical protein
VPGFPIERRLFITALGAAALAACSRAGGGGVLPGATVALPTPQSTSPGAIVPPPMVQTSILPSSAMTSRTPAGVNIPLNWTQIPGSASHVTAALDGSLWVLSDGPAGPDKNIWHYSGGNWTNVGGLAKKISVAPNGTLYVLNSAGSIYAYAGGTWTPIAGGGSDITVLADNSIVVVSDTGPADKGIWHLPDGGSWTQFPGGGVAVHANKDGNTYAVAGQANRIIPGGFYVINSIGSIYYMNTDSVLLQLPANASNVASAVGGVFALSYPANAGGNGIYFYDFAGQSWVQQSGTAIDLSFNAGDLFVLSGAGGIYRTAAAIPVPMTLDMTQAGLPAGTLAYAYVIGGYSIDGGHTLKNTYWMDATGTPRIMSTADNTNPQGTFPNTGGAVSPADVATLNATYNTAAWADYSIPLATSGAPTTVDISKLSPAYLPGLGTGTAAFSGRIYISLGVPKLPFSPTAPNAYASPGVGAGNPGALCLFDWIEFSYDSNGNFNVNTTQVNGIGLVLRLNGTPGGSAQGSYTVTRSALFAAITALGSPFADLLLANTTPSAFPAGVNHLRIQAPPTVLGNTGYSGGLLTYFDTVISQWYATWQTTPLVCHDVSTGYYTGVTGGSGTPLVFYPGQTATGTPAFTLTGTGTGGMLSSADIFNCISPGGTAEQNVAKVIDAAFNRGVASSLIDDGNCTGGYYPSGVASNGYSKTVHQYSSNGLAYGFGYDDVCGSNPSFTLSPAATVSIVLQPLS